MESTKFVHLTSSLSSENGQPVTTISMDEVPLIDSQTPETVCILNEGDMTSVTTLFPPGVEIQPTPIIMQQDEIEDISMVTENQEEQIMHLQIQQAAESETSPSEDAHHVFFVYRDIFTCGACSNQFEEMLEFLKHKSQHTIGEEVYKCELCKMVVLSQSDLQEHYSTLHNVAFPTNDSNDAVEDVEVKKETVLNSVKIEPPATTVTTPLKKSHRKSENSRKQKFKITHDVTEEPTIVCNNDTVLNEETLHDPVIEDEANDLALQGNDIEEESPKKVEPIKDFSFIMLSETIKGAKITYTRTWFKCLHCDFRSRMKRCLIKHMTDQHQDLLSMHNSMVIKEDDAPTTYMHKVGESQGRLMRLSTYDALFPMTGKKKKRRIEKQDLPGVFTCNQCGKVFSRLRYLRKHTQTHQKVPTEKRFACEECGKTFKFKNYLRVHQNSHKNKHFKCNECDFESNINAAIHAHRQVHNQGSVICDVCGFAYTDKSTLNKHKRVHDMTRPYACNFPGCTWRFKTEVMCKAHIRAHTTEGKFPCWICGYLFRHKHHLQRHLKKMHNLELSGKELDAHCNAHAISRTSTETQGEDHFVGLQLQCTDCGLTFVSRYQLDRHLSKAHNIQLNFKELDDLYAHTGDPGGLLAQAGGDGDGRMQVITAIAPEDFEQAALSGGADQPVYVAIENSSLAHFETDPNSALEMNTLYVQEEQEVPISEEEARDEKTFFVSVL